MPPDEPPQRRRCTSVRVGVTVVASIGVAAVLASGSVLLVMLQAGAATGQLDEILSDEAEAIGVSAETGTQLPMLLDDDRVVVVYDEEGNVAMSAGDVTELVGHDVRTADDRGVDILFAGQVHRVVSEPYLTADGSGRVVLAEPRDELDDSVDSLIRSLAIIVPGAVAALAVVVWAVVGRTLRPVEAIRAEVASIGVTQLDRRVPVPPGDDEVARLAGTMNDMLARLEQSVRAQQQFVADASHEMRTPLTRMRTRLEVEERHPGAADPHETNRAQLAELRGMQALLDELLILAKGDDAGFGPLELIDLDDLVMEEVSSARLLVPVDASDVSSAQVMGVPSALRRLVSNLVDNATEHARSQIVVSLSETDRGAVLTVDDDGPGIPPRRRTEVFERFARLDAARPGDGHHGLGLAIAAEIARFHDGSLEALDAPSGGARLQLVLPAAGTRDIAAREASPTARRPA